MTTTDPAAPTLDLATATPDQLAAAYGTRYHRLPRSASGHPGYQWDGRRLLSLAPAPARGVALVVRDRYVGAEAQPPQPPASDP